MGKLRDEARNCNSRFSYRALSRKCRTDMIKISSTMVENLLS